MEEVNVVQEHRHERIKPRLYRDVVTNQPRTFDTPRNNNYDRVRRQNHESSNNPGLECWACKKTGHIIRDCPVQRIVTCYACGEQGHVRNNCPKMRRRQIECFACGKQEHVRRNCLNIVCGKCNLRGHK